MGAKKWQLWEKQNLFSLSYFFTDQEHLNCVFSFLTLQPISTASFTYHYLIQKKHWQKALYLSFPEKKQNLSIYIKIFWCILSI